MDDGLVGAMIAAIRRANRDWAVASQSRPARFAPRSQAAAEARRIVLPALLPTVFAPSGIVPATPDEEKATARRV